MLFQRTAYLLLALWAVALPAGAETRLQTLRTAEDAKGWEAVGRILVDNRASCSGALIADDLVLTAAHCLYLPGQPDAVHPATLLFLPDFRNGRSGAEHKAKAIAIHPDFDYDPVNLSGSIASDVALIKLATPVASARVTPFETTARPRKGASVSVVSYGQGRQDHASLQEDCSVLARRSGVLVLDCDVVQGSSGAPVFTLDDQGTARIVSVISSASKVRGKPVALGTDLVRPLAVLMQNIAQATPDTLQSTKPKVRRMQPSGSQTAKFVRP